jgi:hypothetical protein
MADGAAEITSPPHLGAEDRLTARAAVSTEAEAFMAVVVADSMEEAVVVDMAAADLAAVVVGMAGRLSRC